MLRSPTRFGFALVLAALGALVGCGREGSTDATEPAVSADFSALSIGGRCTSASLAAGDNHTCLVRGSGAVACWGSSSSYQSGSLVARVVTPVEVIASGAVAVAAGTSHTCALKTDGTVWCWGSNSSGQLGDATTISRRVAPAVVPNLSGVGAISAGSLHTCALKNNGTVWCWGSGASGRLGNNATTVSRVPVQAVGLTNATEIAAGGSHTCAATADGGIYCWGSNSYGQLGEGTTTARRVPTRINTNASPVRSLAAGLSHTCAVLQAPGTPVQCWGRNQLGQLGDGSPDRFRRVPGPVYEEATGAPLGDAVAVVAGASSSCVLLGDGSARCWGANTSGQLGDGTTTPRPRAVPVTAPAGLAGRFLIADGGASHSCALSWDGDVYCWGLDSSGQLGDGLATGTRLAPRLVGGARALTFQSFAGEDQVSAVGGALATSIVGNGGRLFAAGVDHQTGFDRWIVRQSSNSGATWSTSLEWSFESGAAMGAPHLVRAPAGQLFLAGGATDDEGTERWIVRVSSDDGATWLESDELSLEARSGARAHAARWDTLHGRVLVAGSASDGAVRHAIVRSADPSAVGGWSTVHDSVLGSADSVARDVLASSLGAFVLGDYATGAGARMFVRQGADFDALNAADEYQYAAGYPTTGVALASDLGGRVYALARAGSATGTRWVLRAYSAADGWRTASEVQVSAGFDTEALGLFVDGADAIHVVGRAARAGEQLHAVLWTSYDHGVTWVVRDELGATYASAFYGAVQDSTGALHVAGAAGDNASASRWVVRSLSCFGLERFCGNGLLDDGELCDGNCSDCSDGDACTSDVRGGAPETCDVTCTHTPISACGPRDGCCPAGCNILNDLDCCQGQIVNNVCLDESFRIDELSSTSCWRVEHATLTGDERGAIAVSSSQVFYTGAGPRGTGLTARFNAADLSSGRSTGRGWGALVSDLATGAVYNLANNTTPIAGTGTVNALIAVNGTTGASGQRITLRTPISVVAGSTGIFAGYGRFLVHNGAHVYDVKVPSGVVTDLGAMNLPAHNACPTWAFWGTAEYFDGKFYLDYANGSTIYRTQVPSGETTVLAEFTDLGGMCSFTYAPNWRRWYFHVHGPSQFGSGTESIGYCTGQMSRPNAPPVCGDGVLEFGEVCDLNCPSCTDTDNCTLEVNYGSACNPICGHVPFTPTVSGFSPTSGRAGETITIYGSYLYGITGLTIGGRPATIVSVRSGYLTATVPVDAVTGPIVLNTLCRPAASADSFTLLAPVVSGFTPASGVFGSTVTITGSYFNGASSVRFGGVSATYTVNNDGSITATVPENARSGVISVTTPSGVGSSSGSFVVTTPGIVRLSPSAGPMGATITIVGANFTGATSVRFNGVASSYTVVDADTIRSTVPQTTTGPVTVTTPGGTATSPTPFAVLDLSIAAVYVTQATQSLTSGVPLIAGRDGLLRVLVVGSDGTGAAPRVRVRVWDGTNALQATYLIDAPSGGIPADVARAESSLTRSWNQVIPGSLVQPNYRILAEVDPDAAVPETDETNNVWPASGTAQTLDVRGVPRYDVTLWAVQTGDGRVGGIDAAGVEAFTEVGAMVQPIGDSDRAFGGTWSNNTILRANSTGWTTVLNALEAKRIADGSPRYYFGVVNPDYKSSGGMAGLGFVSGRSALGWDATAADGPGESGRGPWVFAHEIGHNLSLQHSPCGATAGVDPSYPHTGAYLGVWGIDLSGPTLKDPATYHDIMSYCGPVWASDYSFTRALNYWRVQSHSPEYPAMAADVVGTRSLLLSGREEDGVFMLEPAFRLTREAPAPVAGDERVEGFDATGKRLFTAPLELRPVDDLPAGKSAAHFALAVPLAEADAERLASLRWRRGDKVIAVREATTGARAGHQLTFPKAGEARLTWDAAAYPEVMVRDLATGYVIGTGHGPEGVLGLKTEATDLEVMLSDGVHTTTRRWRRAP